MADGQLNATQQLDAALQAINSGNAKVEWQLVGGGSEDPGSWQQVLVGNNGQVFQDVKAQDLGGGQVKLTTSAPETFGANSNIGITTSINPSTGTVAPITSQDQVAVGKTVSSGYGGGLLGDVIGGTLGAANDYIDGDFFKALPLFLAAAGGIPSLEGAGAGASAGTTGSTMLDYSAPTSTGGLGLQGSAALDGTLSSGLAAPAGGSLGGGLGLTAGTAGNLAAMGGAQGLLANAAGGGTLSAAGVNTGLLTADNLAKVISGGGSAAADLTKTLTNLTPDQVTTLAKAGINVAGILGAGAAVKGITNNLTNTGGGGMLTQQDRSGVSSGSAQYSPEYYQAIQAKYNQMMPQQPRDVTTDLKSWYETKYAPKVA